MSDYARLLRVRVHFPLGSAEQTAVSPEASSWERAWRREMVFGWCGQLARGAVPVGIGLVLALAVAFALRARNPKPAPATNRARAVAIGVVAPQRSTPMVQPLAVATEPALDAAPETVKQTEELPSAPQAPEAQYGANGDQRLARLALTSGIRGREPVDRLGPVVDGAADRVYCFTELVHMKGATVVHRWEHAGRVMARLRFTIGGDRWRVYSSKRLGVAMGGHWRVVVTDAAGTTLGEKSFVFHQPRAARSVVSGRSPG